MTRRRVNRRGSSAVEFAVVLPLIFILFLGSVEVGRAIMVQHSLQEAAKGACRIYTVKENSEQQVHGLVDKAMEEAGITNYTVELEPLTKADLDEHMEPVTVTVSVAYEDVAWMTPWYMGGATIAGRCTMPADLEEAYEPSGGTASPDPPPDNDDDD